MLASITVSFPGLGIDFGEIDSVAFTIGDSFSVMWYGVIIALGMLFALAYTAFRCKQNGISVDDLIDTALFTIIFGVIGARLYYVAFNPDPFDSFLDIINLRSGGLAIYGGIIAGAATVVIVCLIKKISWRKLFDCAAPGVMIAQSMGRWGNFFNGEAYGALVEESHPLYFLRMGLISRNTYNDFGTTAMCYVHPTFLYESMWNLLGFVLINIFYKKKKFDGQIALYYFAWYGFGRMFIEGLRTDALYIGKTGIRVSQLLGFLLFAVASALIVYGLVCVRKKELSRSFATVSANGVHDINDSEAEACEEPENAEENGEQTQQTEEPAQSDGDQNVDGENN